MIKMSIWIIMQKLRWKFNNMVITKIALMRLSSNIVEDFLLNTIVM